MYVSYCNKIKVNSNQYRLLALSGIDKFYNVKIFGLSLLKNPSAQKIRSCFENFFYQNEEMEEKNTENYKWIMPETIFVSVEEFVPLLKEYCDGNIIYYPKLKIENYPIRKILSELLSSSSMKEWERLKKKRMSQLDTSSFYNKEVLESIID